MRSLRARVIRRGFAVSVRVLRALRGGLPGPDAPPDQLESYALAAREQLEGIAGRLRQPRSAHVADEGGAAVRSLWVIDRDAVTGVDDPDDDAVRRAVAEPGRYLDRVVLYLHGGAYCLGSPELFRGLAADLSREARAAVVVPDYRLAPEHPFPAALDDAAAVWDRLTLELGVDPARIAVAGDSSGGGLAAALCLRLRDQGRQRPACLVGISPWTDLAATGRSIVDNDTADIWIPGDLIRLVGRAYAGDVAVDDPLVSPLYGDLTALPPTLVHVSTDEVLLDDAQRFVDAARAHGVDASLGRFDGLWHVFHAFPGFPESRSAVRELGAFVRRHTTPVTEGLAA